MLYDLFICHASEDKDAVVRPLAEALRNENIEVWYDEFSLKLGDSIRQSIDRGLLQSRFGVIILSKAFFSKRWPQYELDGLAEREMAGNDKVILPILHGISHDDIRDYSLSLANKYMVSTNRDLKDVLRAIVEVVRPQQSPLITARDILLERGVTPPVITDEYWLNVVEASNRAPSTGAIIPEESIWDRWSFPLPPKEGGAQNWGERLAWTAMQLKWVDSADEIPITPFTKPEIVLAFIRDQPGLHKICEMFPDLLAEYAPQLTIPGMGGEFEGIFEYLYEKAINKSSEMHSGASSQKVNKEIDNAVKLTDELWALRHPHFGFLKPATVAHEYFTGGMFGPRVSPYEHADHLFWLLSNESSWMPEKIREFLIEGMTSWSVWTWSDINIDKGGNWKTCGSLARALYDATRGNEFKFNQDIRDDITNRIEMTISVAKLTDSCQNILDNFFRYDVIDKYIRADKNIKSRRG